MSNILGKFQTVLLLGGLVLVQGCNTSQNSSGVVKNTAVDRAIGKCVGSVAISTIGGALIGAAFGGNSGARQGALAGAVVGVGYCVVLLELAADEDKRQLRAAELAALEADGTSTSSIITKSGKSAQVTTRVTAAPPPKTAKPKPVAKQVAKKTEPGPSKVGEPAPDISATPEGEMVMITVDQGPASVVNPEPAVVSGPSEDIAPATELAFFEEKPDTTTCRFTELFINIDGRSAETEKQKWCRGGDGSWQPVEG